MNNKIKHLEFIQSVITRMNSNSFLIKGWSLSLISALLAFSAKDANASIGFISYVIILVFWVLDGFYISQERQYRDLYASVRSKQKDDEIDFDMNASVYCTGNRTWLAGIFSKTLVPFYGLLIATTAVVMLVIMN